MAFRRSFLRALLHAAVSAAIAIGVPACNHHDAPPTPTHATDHASTVSSTGLACSATGEGRRTQACQPIVMVVRHAEDASSPANAHYLTDAGKNHAQLYVSLVHDYVYGNTHGLGAAGAEVCVCPVGKVIS